MSEHDRAADRGCARANHEPSEAPTAQELLERFPIIAGIAQTVGPSDALLVTGSAVSQLSAGNDTIDLLLTGSGQRQKIGVSASLASTSEVTYQTKDGGSAIVRMVSADQLHALGTRLAFLQTAVYEPAMMVRLAHFDLGALLLLHEMRHGVVVKNEAVADHWRGQLNVEALDLQILLQFCDQARRRVPGMRKHLERGDTETTQLILREVYDSVAMARLATVGETNCRPRWRLKLLERHRHVIGSQRVDMLKAGLTTWYGQGEQVRLWNAVRDAEDEVLSVRHAVDSIAAVPCRRRR